MSNKSTIRILIVEDEEEIRELVAITVGAHIEAQFIEASCGRDAVDILTKEGSNISLVLCDFNMPRGNGGVVYGYIQENLPNLAFILMTSDAKEEHSEITEGPLSGYVQKPFFDDSITTEIDRLLKKSAVKVSKDPDYAPISLSTLERVGEIKSPLFVRLSEDHYVKVTNENMKFTTEDRDRFLKKGALYLYVPIANFSMIVKDFKNNVFNNMFLDSMRYKHVEKMKLTKNIQEILLTAVKTMNWDDDIVDLGNKNVQLVQATVDSVPQLCEAFDWFDSDEHEYGILHCILISYCLTWLCKDHVFNNRRGLEVLTLAAFFHDASLEDHHIRNENRFVNAISIKSSVNKSDLELVRLHPVKSAELISVWKNAPADLIQVIRQHHEMNDGSGFPDGLKSAELNELTGAFMIAQEIVDSYLLHKDKSFVKKALVDRADAYNSYPTAIFYQKALALL